ncbi:hypothetical protein RhiirA5_421384 [Rhizophagus irregularis]|uniref:MIR domain-containing protein n=2 Tax=Rhizophagus irregularis TaxID=588596 RepID=A0A2N0PE21_9GLOM|nr:hypothetical protein GLOIN_2v1767445 [Rhizophagus irregularis DAOM 181602=DAOM 197198]PKC05070.1 hypothetical protein RhiirA5_421384 [Rhizophagus irregularis]POG77875.1 hypothetical protein GLOIN_2v1767445 [Rhizophagus irregularis DAOM 181602=DAOM 197198]|eukprot:XP_025184741.1 hypothetical protein GLOIN_2v1767445 [Rhizophagus irregularis DAOM 181602=DAOM 197198]
MTEIFIQMKWINDIQKYLKLRYIAKHDDDYLNIAISLFEELSNALKEDISFTLFKCTNTRLLESLRYITEVKEFAKIIADESNLIRNNSIVALKHDVATGKYLSSIDNLCYITGSKNQLAFAGSPEPDLNALWKISTFKEKFPMYNKTSIKLRHIKSGNVLGLFMMFNLDTFQEIVGHNEIIEEWCIELIKRV